MIPASPREQNQDKNDASLYQTMILYLEDKQFNLEAVSNLINLC